MATSDIVEFTLTRLERRLKLTMPQGRTYRVPSSARERERAEFLERCRNHLDHAARVIEAELEGDAYGEPRHT